ncbi:hypothetical protein [Sporisorium scitamineum]|uniref:peptidyl-tRNA hydrolase n=1 Tax=Sporisorium scitamineum TaxID=49012 RepID=A0A0F7S3L2_9BASI|nr:hypothetical protein [Sporisorium scitamineum]
MSTRASSLPTASANASTSASATGTPLVMQLIVDGSSSTLTWPKGPLMAQSAHAAISAIQISLSSPLTQTYVSPSNLGLMHKVVLQTPASGKAKMDLHELSAKLTEARKPENVPTCLAIAPNSKPAALKKILRPCTLLKD